MRWLDWEHEVLEIIVENSILEMHGFRRMLFLATNMTDKYRIIFASTFDIKSTDKSLIIVLTIYNYFLVQKINPGSSFEQFRSSWLFYMLALVSGLTRE
jgi:hypothetical protein